ncbi:DUF374 domain-containing protein [Candidatus Fermentibacterales bacterium]|nr:DUF374 domain-containing protein [Candidatus Fermentibacterales bacterium]
MPDLLALSRGAGRVLVSLLGRSWRVLYIRPSSTGRSGRARGRPVLFGCWHGRQLPFIHTHRGEGVAVMVSRHRDGQYVANVLESMGFGTVRGSSSRGGLQALRGMSALLRSGVDGAVTPDGPRGPAEKAGEGLGFISMLGGRPFVPMGAAGWPAISFRSWDSFVLPLPASRVAIVEGRPIPPVPAGSSDGIREARLELMESEIRRVTALADFVVSPSARILYACARLLSCLASPVARAALVVLARGRERRERLGLPQYRSDRPVWLHGASLGEVRGLLPVAGMLSRGGLPVHVTCTSRSARALIEDRGYRGSLAPLDSVGCVRSFLRSVRPRMLVLAETELWPCTLTETLLSGVPAIMVNARLSERRMPSYRVLSGFLGRLLSCFCAVLCRTPADLERFAELGVDRRCLMLAPDTKAASEPEKPPSSWRKSLSVGGRRVLVAGSTRPGEELPVVAAALDAGLFPVIAPRHVERAEQITRQLREDLGADVARWSVSGADPGGSDCLLVDVHGVLGALYGAADVAFVGGTIAPIGGHNVLEPLQHGVPVVVGPHHQSFASETATMVERGWALISSSREELSEAFSRLADSRPDAAAIHIYLAGLASDGLARLQEMISRACGTCRVPSARGSR